MVVSKQDAASALSEIHSAGDRAARLLHYRDFAPHALIWGTIWIVANVAIDLLGGHGTAVWLSLIVPGSVASSWIGARTGRKHREAGDTRPSQTWRWLAMFLALLVYFNLVIVVLAPATPAQAGAYIALSFAAAYVFAGIWLGWKIVAMGLAMAALILGGYFSGAPHLQVLSGSVAGVAMVICGLWMRRA